MSRVGVAVALLSIYNVTLLAAGIADRLILFPTTHPLGSHGAERKSIPFQNGSLEIWTARSKVAEQLQTPELFLLRFYGNADRSDRWVADEAEMWGKRGVEVWGVNYPGFGGSTGPAQLSRIGPAALTAF